MFNERKFSFGGYKLMPLYRLDREFIDLFERSSFQETVDLVLKPPKKSLAERVANGLGWLARSRQSSDLSERLLYGFTALEALLSQQDQFSPVLDAMARMASVILSNDVSKRERIYSDLKSLYSIRSNLVHRGVRNVSKIDANNIQYISERCFQIVLQHIDLHQKHDDFISKLKISTHGSPWS